MPSAPYDENEQEAPTPRRDDLRFDPKKEPTKSLLNNERWVEEIKRNLAAQTTKPPHMLGPFYREGVPYRAKLSLPFESGDVIVIKGRVWSYHLQIPVPATLDVWQTDSGGHYDKEARGVPASEQSFINRASVLCDESGHYEFETVRPGAYERLGVRHAAHIHVRVRYPGHVDCVTQILFSDDEYHAKDPYREDSAIVELREVPRNGQKYKEGVFDFVLAQER